MVGGTREAFEKVKPLFEVMGETIPLVGGSGAGQTCKVANQMIVGINIVGINIAAVSEALVLASKAGLEAVRVGRALLGGFASSRILEVHGQWMIERAFEPGGRIGLHQKDLSLAVAEAGRLGVAMPMTSICRDLMYACTARGGAGRGGAGWDGIIPRWSVPTRCSPNTKWEANRPVERTARCPWKGETQKRPLLPASPMFPL